MGKSGWRLSAFGDEVSDDLHEQLRIIKQCQIGFLELRGVWGKNVLHLSDEEVREIANACSDQSIGVSAIGSPVGKSSITLPLAYEMANLERTFAIASLLDTRLVRVFSFYPPEAPDTKWPDEALVEESITRLMSMTEAARRAGMQLLLENESGIVGDSVARCQRLLDAVDSTNLGFAWDPANFVHVGEAAAVTEGWNVLGARTRHVHIKDYRMATGEILPAGEGDGQIDLLLQKLATVGYDGFLVLEPHLSFAGKSSGFSGADGMERAVIALRSILSALGLVEQQPSWLTGASL